MAPKLLLTLPDDVLKPIISLVRCTLPDELATRPAQLRGNKDDKGPFQLGHFAIAHSTLISMAYETERCLASSQLFSMNGDRQLAAQVSAAKDQLKRLSLLNFALTCRTAYMLSLSLLKAACYATSPPHSPASSLELVDTNYLRHLEATTPSLEVRTVVKRAHHVTSFTSLEPQLFRGLLATLPRGAGQLTNLRLALDASNIFDTTCILKSCTVLQTLELHGTLGVLGCPPPRLPGDDLRLLLKKVAGMRYLENLTLLFPDLTDLSAHFSFMTVWQACPREPGTGAALEPYELVDGRLEWTCPLRRLDLDLPEKFGVDLEWAYRLAQFFAPTLEWFSYRGSFGVSPICQSDDRVVDVPPRHLDPRQFKKLEFLRMGDGDAYLNYWRAAFGGGTVSNFSATPLPLLFARQIQEVVLYSPNLAHLALEGAFHMSRVLPAEDTVVNEHVERMLGIILSRPRLKCVSYNAPNASDEEFENMNAIAARLTSSGIGFQTSCSRTSTIGSIGTVGGSAAGDFADIMMAGLAGSAGLEI